MKPQIVALLLMVFPVAVFADAMATCVTVFDAATFRTLTATNAIGQVRDGDLFTKSVFCSFFGSKGQGKDDVSGDYTWDKKQYRLLIGRREGKTIYTVLLITENQSTQIVAVGEILSKQTKDDPKGDPFVVVIRGGNYLKQ